MPDYVTDTHALIWYLEDDPRLGPGANDAFDDCDRGAATIYVPTICLVEIVYLAERGRIAADFRDRLSHELRGGESGLSVVNLTAEIVEALAAIGRADVPEMPDRIIAATALHLGLPLISRDRQITLSEVPTVW